MLQLYSVAWLQIQDSLSLSSVSRVAKKEARVFTMTLPFHPLFAKLDFCKVLNQVFSGFKYELENLFGPVAFRIAWRKAGPHLVHRVRSCSRNGTASAPKGGW